MKTKYSRVIIILQTPPESRSSAAAHLSHLQRLRMTHMLLSLNHLETAIHCNPKQYALDVYLKAQKLVPHRIIE